MNNTFYYLTVLGLFLCGVLFGFLLSMSPIAVSMPEDSFMVFVICYSEEKVLREIKEKQEVLIFEDKKELETTRLYKSSIGTWTLVFVKKDRPGQLCPVFWEK